MPCPALCCVWVEIHLEKRNVMHQHFLMLLSAVHFVISVLIQLQCCIFRVSPDSERESQIMRVAEKAPSEILFSEGKCLFPIGLLWFFIIILVTALPGELSVHRE